MHSGGYRAFSEPYPRPGPSVISTSNARIKATTSVQRMSDGVGVAKMRSAVRRCLDRSVCMIPKTALPILGRPMRGSLIAVSGAGRRLGRPGFSADPPPLPSRGRLIFLPDPVQIEGVLRADGFQADVFAHQRNGLRVHMRAVSGSGEGRISLAGSIRAG